MQRLRSAPPAGGFTLIETMVVMLFMAIVMTLGMPALQQMIHRARLEGIARETSVMCHSTRLEAIKGGIPTVIRFDITDRTIVSWVDANGDNVQDVGERELMRRQLPAQADFLAPGGMDAIGGLPTDGDGAWLTFNIDGSIQLTSTGDCDTGLACVRLADSRPNYLELSIGPAATASVKIRKWNGTEWQLPGDGGQPWHWK